MKKYFNTPHLSTLISHTFKLRKVILNIILIGFLLGSDVTGFSQGQCGTDQLHLHMLATDPEYKLNMEKMEKEIRELIQDRKKSDLRFSEIYTIPVVVHVIHLGEPEGTGTNISDDQIYRAINGLNDRWKNLIGDGVDMQIEFCLAKRDPYNQPTIGIIRKNGSSISNYSTLGIQINDGCGANENSIKDLSKWPVKDYYNIWVVNKICGGPFLGYAGYPGNHGEYNGTVLLYNTMEYTANPSPIENYDQSTLAHEIGHGFNLKHTFDLTGTFCPPDSDCLITGDLVCDTPPHSQGSCGQIQPCPSLYSWANTNSNYMSYCIQHTRFTQDQKERVRAAAMLESRNTLLTSLGCLSPSQYDTELSQVINPVKSTYISGCERLDTIFPVIEFKNNGSEPLTSVSINYKLNNGINKSYKWIGNILPTKKVQVQLPEIEISEGQHSLVVYTFAPNGNSDGYVLNDTIKFDFIAKVAQPIELTYISQSESCVGKKNGSLSVNHKYITRIVEDFESETDWIIVNGDQPNRWVIGEATGGGSGKKSIYISDDGVSNNFNTNNQSIVHFYKDFYFPENAKNIKIKFDWKCASSVNSSDYIGMAIIPINHIPVPGLLDYFHTIYENKSSFINIELNNLDSLVGKSKKIVFSWQNNNIGGTQPPGAIDNIEISYSLPPAIPITYGWQGFPNQSSNIFTNVSSGFYKVSVSDSNGCIDVIDMMVNGADSLKIETIFNDITCLSPNEGEITVNPLNGISPLKYEWSSGESSQSIQNLPAGNYKLTISDHSDVSDQLPIAASCTPNSIEPGFSIGIYNVNISSINNNSLSAQVESYQDFTNVKTFLHPYDEYELKVQTGPNYPEKALAWIDFNDNGIFETTELILNSINNLPNRVHRNKFKIPLNAEVYRPLRLRVGTDISSGQNTFSGPCNNSRFGQIEDYTVIIGFPSCTIYELNISVEAPPPAIIQNSNCIVNGCILESGLILAPEINCPEDFSIQYSTDTLQWFSEIPEYDNKKSITVFTRFVYDLDNPKFSKINSITTDPAKCPCKCGVQNLEDIVSYPVIVNNSSCGSGCTPTGGAIARSGFPCPMTTVMQFKVDSGEWTDTLPIYNRNVAQTIITRCACEKEGVNVYSQNSTPVVTNPAVCPCDCGVRNLEDIVSSPVIVSNSSCGSGCAPTGGVIARSGFPCPMSTVMQFKVDNGEWTETLPVYNIDLPQTITTRCACENDGVNVYSRNSTPVVTVPAICPCDCGVQNLEDIVSYPVIVNNSSCGSGCTQTGGAIARNLFQCPMTTVMQFKVDSGEWTDTLPIYNRNVAQTIITRCACEKEGVNVYSQNSTPVVTVPAICPCDCGVQNLEDVVSYPVIVSNSSCGSGCTPTGGAIARNLFQCPMTTVMQFKVDSGEWTDTLPIYNRNVAQTIITRCACEKEGVNVYSQNSTPVVTVPAICPCDCGVQNLEDVVSYPVIVSNSSCGSGCTPTGGAIARSGFPCPMTTVMQFKVDNGEWTETLPVYNKDLSQTITTRCACENDSENVYSQNSTPVVTNPAVCPCDCGVRNLEDVVSSPVIVSNSSCGSGCTPTGGAIARSGFPCPMSTVMQFKVDNGEWTETLPVYNKDLTQTITSRCACENDGVNVYSQNSTPVVTNPAICPCDCGVRNLEDIVSSPVIVSNSSCGSGCTPTGGAIARSGFPCPMSTVMQFKVDNGEWTETLPVYNKDLPQTITTRCACENDGVNVYSQNSTPVVTNPAVCPCDCGVRNLEDIVSSPVIVSNSSCGSGCTPSGGVIARSGFPCPMSTVMQFKVDNGEWTETLPVYNIDLPQTITTRCACENDGVNVYSQNSTPVITIPAVCPCDCGVRNLEQLSSSAVLITNSFCESGCTPIGGTITIGLPTCPGISKLQFKVDDGEWTEILPIYDREIAQSIITRCACENEDVAVYSKPSLPKTTNPASCHPSCYCPNLNIIPNNVSVFNSTCSYPICQPNGGTISMINNNCPLGSTMQYSSNNGTSWSEILPIYFQSGLQQTIITRCNCDSDKSLSSPTSGPVTTNPQKCPSNCPCLSPSIQVSYIIFSLISTNQFTANWTNGNGSRRVVKINTINNFTPPSNGTDPSANPKYSGTGQQVVYNGNGSSVNITGLIPNQTYWVRVYEANCDGINSVYNTTSAISNPNSQRTRTVLPSVQSFTASNVIFEGNNIIDISPIFNTNKPYDTHPPIDIYIEDNNKTRFTLNASYAAGFSFQLVDQLTIVTDGTIAINPSVYGSLKPVTQTSNSSMYMDYIHPAAVSEEPYLDLKLKLLFEGGLVGMSIPIHINPSQSPLPVELTNFSAQYNKLDDINELKWTTKSEVNNDYFNIERSFEREAFRNIGKVDRIGSSSSSIDYIFNDSNIPYDGTYIYRLKQVDMDGKSTTSKLVSVTVSRAPSVKTGLFPNPSTDIINCYVDAYVGAEVNIEVFNNLGQLVSHQNMLEKLSNARMAKQLEGKAFGKGIFTVVFTVDGIRYNHKLIMIE